MARRRRLIFVLVVRLGLAFVGRSLERSHFIARLSTSSDDQVAAVAALERELGLKQKLLTSLEQELDVCLQDAVRAEALLRAAKADEVEAQRRAQVDENEARIAAEMQAEAAIVRPARAVLESALKEKEAAQAATDAVVSKATAAERQAIVAENARAQAAQAEIVEIEANTEAEMAKLASRRDAKISNLERRLEMAKESRLQNAYTFGAGLGFAFLAGVSFAADQLRLPPAASATFGLASLIAFSIYGTDTFAVSFDENGDAETLNNMDT